MGQSHHRTSVGIAGDIAGRQTGEPGAGATAQILRAKAPAPQYSVSLGRWTLDIGHWTLDLIATRGWVCVPSGVASAARIVAQAAGLHH